MLYKVIVEQRETFVVEVEAEGEVQAIYKGEEAFGNGDYKETGDVIVNAIEVTEIK